MQTSSAIDRGAADVLETFTVWKFFSNKTESRREIFEEAELALKGAGKWVK